jgi:hypothetical protein
MSKCCRCDDYKEYMECVCNACLKQDWKRSIENPKLKQHIAELEVQSQWVSVEDRLPEKGLFKMYLIKLKPMIMRVEEDEIVIDLYFSRWENHESDEVTHWMPLPKPPTKEQG